MPKSSFSSSESGIGQEESLDSNRKHFFMSFVPQLESLYRKPGDPIDDPLDDPMADPITNVFPSPTSQRKQAQQLANRPKMIMASTSSCHSRENSNRAKMIMAKSNGDSNSYPNNMLQSRKVDSSMDEIGLIVGHLKSGGPYCEKLVNIMRKGMEKSWPGIYKIFRETGVPDNFCPIVKMNNDNTPYVEFLIKADTADQDPFSQLNGYTAEYMALCKFVVDRIFQDAPPRQSEMAPPPAKKSPMSQQSLLKSKQSPQSLLQPKQSPQSLLQPKQSQQQQYRQQQQQPMQQYRQQQPAKSKTNLDQTFGAPLACSTPKSQRHRVLPPRACKSLNRSDLQH